MGVKKYPFLLLIILLCYCQGGDLDYDGRLTVRLEHSFDNTQPPVYLHRGDILIKSLHSGLATVEEYELTNDQIILLRDLANKGGNYRLRATAKTSDLKENYYYTFVKACSLIESDMVNEISINLDHVGNVIAVSMGVPSRCVGSNINHSALTKFNTTVAVRHMELGPVPDTATYIQKLEREREAKERGEIKDNRSFLAKYWMYIVPVVIFILLPSATNTDTGGGGAQRETAEGRSLWRGLGISGRPASGQRTID